MLNIVSGMGHTSSHHAIHFSLIPLPILFLPGFHSFWEGRGGGGGGGGAGISPPPSMSPPEFFGYSKVYQ